MLVIFILMCYANLAKIWWVHDDIAFFLTYYGDVTSCCWCIMLCQHDLPATYALINKWFACIIYGLMAILRIAVNDVTNFNIYDCMGCFKTFRIYLQKERNFRIYSTMFIFCHIINFTMLVEYINHFLSCHYNTLIEW